MHFRKSGILSQDELYYKMECMGSTLNATTYRDFLKFTMKITPDKFLECVKIFKNIVDTTEWSKEELQKEKKVVINQLIEKGNYISVENEVQKLVFKNHPLSKEIIGNQDVIEQLTEDDLVEYKKEMFTSKNILFCITGNVTDFDCENMIKDLQTVPIKTCSEVRRLEHPECFHIRKPDIVFIDTQDSNPIDVNISFDITYNESKKDALTILNCILGEGVGSRLQKRIREECCYTSDIFSYIEWYRNFAVLHIRFSVEKKKFYDCFDEIITVLRNMKCGITKKDLDVTLPFYTTNQIFDEDDTEKMNFQLAYNEFILELEYRGVKLENNKETISTLHNLGNSIFVKNNMSIVLVGNTKNLTKKNVKEIISKL